MPHIVEELTRDCPSFGARVLLFVVAHLDP